MRYNKDKTLYINRKVNEDILNQDLQFIAKGKNQTAPEKRIEVQNIKKMDRLYNVNLYSLDFTYKVFYGKNGNAYRTYIKSNIFNLVMQYAICFDSGTEEPRKPRGRSAI